MNHGVVTQEIEILQQLVMHAAKTYVVPHGHSV